MELCFYDFAVLKVSIMQPFSCKWAIYWPVEILVAEHTQDKHVQRDDEFYDGDNDNDHDMEDASWIPIPWLPEPLVTY